MDQEVRNVLQRATQQIRRLLEEEFAEQLAGTFDILQSGKILSQPGKHLDARQRLTRQKLVEAIEHIKAGGKTPKEAVEEYTREAAFTFLNRFVALRMLESRGMLQECVSKGDQSNGFKEFCGLASGLTGLPDGGYRLYLECLLDELSVEVKVLFDRRDHASLLWPRRAVLTELSDILAQRDLAIVWTEDETIGWVYQYFNSGEERKKMREESQAPRNSRELAVRNQFFTPRYVVEFLTDNTLGRIWYEMRRGQTRLVDECQYLVRRPSERFLSEGEEPPADDSEAKQDLNQEERLKRTVYIPHRAKKDPRDLRILDPACGSGHFLLYAFDLLLSIYEEAWNDETSPPALEVKGPDGKLPAKQLRDDYPDLEQLHSALPGLILAHNLHGIDIDARSAQIAALALWMRGQRAFNGFHMAREQRPAIARSNIVCAESMPGEAAYLSEFIAEDLSRDSEGRFLASLVRKVFDAMKLADEAGSLLKIETDIADEVAKAKKHWLERPEYKQQMLFDDGPTIVQKELNLPLGITDESFWEEAEQRIYSALRTYTEQADRSVGFQRRLFAVDAAGGFAFIDLFRQRYDVVVMNPPFGDCVRTAVRYVRAKYTDSSMNLYAAFVTRGIGLLSQRGMLGAITSRTGFFLSTFQKWRQGTLLGDGTPVVLADLGYGVLDAKVETAAYCIGKTVHQCQCTNASSEVFFIDLLACEEKSKPLMDAVSQLGTGRVPRKTWLVSKRILSKLPGSCFAYGMPQRVQDLYDTCESFECASRQAKSGLETGDDFRFLRAWWEVANNDILDASNFDGWRDKSPCFQRKCRDATAHFAWVTFAKGGKYSPYYSDIPLVINWKLNGQEVRQSGNMRNEGFYFLPGITFLARTSIRFCASLLPAGSIISHGAGPGVFVPYEELAATTARLSSVISEYIVASTHARGIEGDDQTKKYTLGMIQALPWPESHEEEDDGKFVEALQLLRLLREADERCREFTGYRQIDQIEYENCGRAIWALDENIAKAFRVSHAEAARVVLGSDGEEDSSLREIVRTLKIASLSCEREQDAFRRVSYAVGDAFGRWRPCEPVVRSKDWSMCKPLPARPHAMNAADYHTKVVLVDDKGHPDDIVNCLTTIDLHSLEEEKGEFIREALESICPKERVEERLRMWLRREFFGEHVKHYSAVPRKAPIYWQLATNSASYSVWLYYHCFTRDTFFQVLNEYVKPKLDHERHRLARLRTDAGSEPTRSQRKEIEDQEQFVAELASMTEEVERIAPLWNPNLNDGVIINFAPLWRLVPQNKSWQKECKKVWDNLVKGEYDWAHLAMHLWPERVVPKCVTDACLAIAHGIDDVFWEQDDRDRFQPKEERAVGWQPTIDRMVKERISPAVKAALQSLLEAPTPTNGSGRSRGRRSAGA